MNDTTALSLPMSPLRITLAFLLAVSLAGCDALARFTTKPDKAKPDTQEETAAAAEQPPPIPPAKERQPAAKPKKTALYEWKGDGRPVTRIVINTNEQKARFYVGADEVGWTTVATGVSKHPTPTGQFQVMEKVANKRSNLYGKVYGKGGKVIRSSVKVGRDPIPAGGRFEGARMPYFMRLTYDGVGMHAGPIPRPGRPASHGCIRMPSKFAPLAFKHVSEGTSVEIVGKGPSYGNYVAKQRAIAARQAEERKRRAAQQTAERSSAPAAEQVASASQAAPAPAAAPSTTATAAAVAETAQSRDMTAPAATLDTSPPRETRPRIPAEEGVATAVEGQTAQSSTTTAPSPAESAQTSSPGAVDAATPEPTPQSTAPQAAVPPESAPGVMIQPKPEPPSTAAPAAESRAPETPAPAAPEPSTPAAATSTPTVTTPAQAPSPSASAPGPSDGNAG